jgi:hypothetical protein
MFVLTDENDIVKDVSFIPGLGSFPPLWHAYFPVCSSIPAIGEHFIPPMAENEHLYKEEGITLESARIQRMLAEQS